MKSSCDAAILRFGWPSKPAKRLLLLGPLALALVAPVAPASAQSIPWPLVSTTAVHEVYAQFGQFATDSGGGTFHFHEGIDIPAPYGTAVYAVEAGTVVERVGTGYDSVPSTPS